MNRLDLFQNTGSPREEAGSPREQTGSQILQTGSLKRPKEGTRNVDTCSMMLSGLIGAAFIILLPPASEGWGKVIFSVCSHLGRGAVPISHNALQHYTECHGAPGGVPCQVQPGGVGTLAGGVPWWGGYPGWGGTQLGQHREYLLHGGRYASCVHAGGLSCLFCFSFSCPN